MEPQKILIIDDEEIIVDILKRRFNRIGWHVLTAYDGQTGISIIKNESLDAIICDIKMPSNTNGTDVLEIAHKFCPQTPFVAISGYIMSDENVVKIMDRGARLFLKKPFSSLKDVTSQISALVEENRLQNLSSTNSNIPTTNQVT